MRKLFNEFFRIPKHGKIREKVMLARLAITITIVVACLAAMSFSAYAYFSYNVVSGFNIIKSATFKTEVQVQITDEAGNVVETITPITSNRKSFKIEGLEIGEFYTVSIKPINDDTAAKTGFVIVTADNCLDTYHTQQLGIDENVPGGRTEDIKFKLMVTDSAVVYLQSHWGTSSYYADYQNKYDELYITQGEEIKMIIGGHTKPNIIGNSDKDTAEGTVENTPADTTPEETDTITPPEMTGTSQPTDTTESTQNGLNETTGAPSEENS